MRPAAREVNVRHADDEILLLGQGCLPGSYVYGIWIVMFAPLLVRGRICFATFSPMVTVNS